MKNSNLLAGLAVLVALIAGALALNQPNPVERVVERLGAIPGDVLQSEVWTVGGLSELSKSVPFVATSSQLCQIKNPFGATSTIDFIGAQATRGVNTTGNTMLLSVSTTSAANGYGSSSPALVAGYQVVSGTNFSVAGTPNSSTSTLTNTGGTNGEGLLAGLANVGDTSAGRTNWILGPSEWISWRLATTSAGRSGSFAAPLQGTCELQLKKL